jgi:hypothetical protein
MATTTSFRTFHNRNSGDRVVVFVHVMLSFCRCSPRAIAARGFCIC